MYSGHDRFVKFKRRGVLISNGGGRENYSKINRWGGPSIRDTRVASA